MEAAHLHTPAARLEVEEACHTAADPDSLPAVADLDNLPAVAVHSLPAADHTDLGVVERHTVLVEDGHTVLVGEEHHTDLEAGRRSFAVEAVRQLGATIARLGCRRKSRLHLA